MRPFSRFFEPLVQRLRCFCAVRSRDSAGNSGRGRATCDHFRPLKKLNVLVLMSTDSAKFCAEPTTRKGCSTWNDIDQQRTHNAAKFQQRVPLPTIARQPRRLNAEYGAHLSLAQRVQQAFEARAACSVSRNSEIVINHIDILPAQRARTLHQTILAAFTFQVVFHLIGSGLTDVHTGSPGQMIRSDPIHRRPPRGSTWLAPASTAPIPGAAALARSRAVVRGHERLELLRTVVVGV